jgi:hypothetical protein
MVPYCSFLRLLEIEEIKGDISYSRLHNCKLQTSFKCLRLHFYQDALVRPRDMQATPKLTSVSIYFI